MEAADEAGYRAGLQAGVQAAENLFRMARPQQALDTYAQLLRRALERQLRLRRAPDAAELLVVERLAELAILTARPDAADDLLAAMVQLCLESGNAAAADYAQLKRAELKTAAGRVSEAHSLLGQMSPRIGRIEAITIDRDGLIAWEARTGWKAHGGDGGSVLFTRAYAVLGGGLLHLGQYADALRMFERGRYHATARDAADIARRAVWSFDAMRARAMLEEGDLASAGAVLSGMPRTNEDTRPSQWLMLLELTAKYDLLCGRLGPAIERLREAVGECARAGLAHANAVTVLNLAHALVLLNRVGEAMALVARAKAIAEHLDDDALRQRCRALAGLASARRSSGAETFVLAISVSAMIEPTTGKEDEEAPAATRPQPLGRTSHTGGYLATFEDRALALQWELAHDRPTAVRSLASLQEIYATTDSRLIRGKRHLLAGEAHLAFGEWEAAESQLARAEHLFEECGCIPEKWQAMRLRSAALAKLRRLCEAMEASLSSDALLESLTASLDATDRPTYLLNKATVAEDFVMGLEQSIASEVRRHATANFVVRAAARWRALGGIHRLLQYLDRYRSDFATRQVSESGSGDAAPNLDGRGLVRRLLANRGCATLVFVVLPDRILIVWSAFMRLGIAAIPVTRMVLREKVRALHESMQRSVPMFGTVGMDALQVEQMWMFGELGKLLRISSLLAALPRTVTRLRIVADDVLHGLPFAALRFDGGYLVERYAIAMVFTTTAVRKPPAGPARTGLIVGIPEVSGRPSLPSAAPECEGVHEWMRLRGIESCLLVGREAGGADARSRLAEASMLHMACHGEFEADRPDRSGLVLVDEENRPLRLSIRELASIPLSKCLHASLSACWSADSFVLPGRWVIGLPEVFCRAGAGSVLGSLWQVVDEVSLGFMLEFYSNIETLPRDEALRQVQMACLSGKLTLPASKGSASSAAPFFWASFTLHGDSGRLIFPR